MHWAYIAGPLAEWKKPDEVCALLDPENYIANWPSVPPDEVRASCVEIELVPSPLPFRIKEKVMLHRRRVAENRNREITLLSGVSQMTFQSAT